MVQPYSELDVSLRKVREQLENLSRASSLTRQFTHMWRNYSMLNLLDLGCATGANFRYLAPRLDCHQNWTLMDRDDSAFEDLIEETEHWAGSHNWTMKNREDRSFTLVADDQQWHVNMYVIALDEEVEKINLGGFHALCSSNFLEKTSAEWYRKLAQRCADAQLPQLLGVNYTSHLKLSPSDPDDALVMEGFHRHIKQDYGLGEAMGDETSYYILRELTNLRFTVQESEYVWYLNSTRQPALINLMIERLSKSAQAVYGEEEEKRIQAWASRRHYAIAAKKVKMEIGYSDILAKPGRNRFRRG